MDELVKSLKTLKRGGLPKKGDFRKNKTKLAKLAQEFLVRPKVKKNSGKGQIQILDFFSGSGGMSAGFHAVAGILPGAFNMLAGWDINPDAAKSYAKNFGTRMEVGDISSLLAPGAIPGFLKRVEHDPRRPLIIIGCAPCQGFSSHRKKNWDKRDSRNNLIKTFAKVATQMDPDCVVMENVPEIYSKKYRSYYEEAKKIFEEKGYVVHQKIYNTASFGVPQERFRFLSVAMKKDFLLPEEMLESKKFLTVRDAIGDLPPIDPGVPYLRDAYHVCARHRPETIEVIKSVPKNGGNRPAGVGPKCLDRVKGFTDVYGRLSWDRPAITITQYARNPASGRYVHPEQDRGLSIREAARLQSFPDHFQFDGKFDSLFKQIGEAVPPKFSCAVAASVLVELLSSEPAASEKSVQGGYTNSPINNSYVGARGGAAKRR